MSRPKRPFSGQETVEWGSSPWMGAPLGVRQRVRWDASTHWSYQVPNGQYDPLTFLHVLDVVYNIEPSIELRSHALAAFLNRVRSQFMWDPITVGKVLSELCEGFEDKLGSKLGLLERGKDYKGYFYVIRHSEEVQTLFVALREDLMKLANLEMAARTARRPPKRLVSPLLECPSLRGEFPGE